MKAFVLVLVLLAAAGGLSCRQHEFRTVTLVCPQVKSARAMAVVTTALSGADGVVSDSVKCVAGSVTVTYDSMRTAVRNLEFAVAEAGFDAGPIPADPKARDALPAECK